MRYAKAFVLFTLVAVSAVLLAVPATAHAEARRWIGYYQPGAPLSTDPLVALESRTKARARVINYFQNTEQGFTLTPVSRATAHGAIPMVTLEFWNPSKGVSQSAYTLRSFAEGDHDQYLRAWARGAKAFGGTVWLRPFHEMNGNWYPWCGTVNGNSPSDFVPAWNHVREVFREEGADNVKFVWCPNIESIDGSGRVGTSHNAIARYWPGAQNVDYIALDGYNFGPASGLKWRSFESLFAAPYAQVSQLSSTTPIFVAETGCATVGGDKSAWIMQMFKVIPAKFPRIEGVCWFNQRQSPSDWRITTTQTAVDRFVAYSSVSAFLDKTVTTATIRRVTTSTPRRYVRFKLAGAMTPRRAGDKLRIEVKKPGSSSWTYVTTKTFISTTSTWSMRYKPTKRGTYYFRTKYAGSYSKRPCTSRVLAVRVR